jgi:hypothetical protein
MTLDGIFPTIVFVVPSRCPDDIFFSGPSNAATLPPEIQRLLNHWRESALALAHPHLTSP